MRIQTYIFLKKLKCPKYGRILELRDKEYLDTKDETFKKKMSEVYKKQVDKSDVFTKESLIRL